jgi:phosphoribosylanthranilate isomerase
MINDCKICGVTDLKTLNYLIDHPFAPKFIGFICNYKKSSRFLEIEKIKELTSINKKNVKFVAILVKPSDEILEKIKDFNFDYYQLYDCSPLEIKSIKDKYKKKIITALTVQNFNDVKKYIFYKDVADIYLFDSKGYEKSRSFDHSLIKNIKFDKDVMLAGNIKFNDDLDKFQKIADIIDISGGVETSGFKDISKIEIFLKRIKDLKNEN